MHIVEGRLGCPECGCPKFESVQDRTAYETETVTGEFVDGSDDPSEFEITEYGDIDTHDADVGDLSARKECVECGHEYERPEFYPSELDVELVAEESGLDVDDVQPFADVIEDFSHVAGLTVCQEKHATVLTAHPASETRGQGPDKWRVEQCTKCQGDMTEGYAKTEQVYAPAPTPSGKQKVFDRRGLPVLVALKVCRSCR